MFLSFLAYLLRSISAPFRMRERDRRQGLWSRKGEDRIPSENHQPRRSGQKAPSVIRRRPRVKRISQGTDSEKPTRNHRAIRYSKWKAMQCRKPHLQGDFKAHQEPKPCRRQRARRIGTRQAAIVTKLKRIQYDNFPNARTIPPTQPRYDKDGEVAVGIYRLLNCGGFMTEKVLLAYRRFGAYISFLQLLQYTKRSKSRSHDAGWSSLVARRAHNPEVVGSNPAPATKKTPGHRISPVTFFFARDSGSPLRDNLGTIE